MDDEEEDEEDGMGFVFFHTSFMVLLRFCRQIFPWVEFVFIEWSVRVLVKNCFSGPA